MAADRRLPVALGMLGAVLVAGTVGYLFLGFGLLDAAYQTVTTVATVGYREVQPLDGAGQVFTMILILVGVGTALYTFSVVLETLIEGRLPEIFGRRRMERRIEAMRGHVILCGWGRVGRAIAREIAWKGTDFVVVDSASARLEDIEHACVVGDATDDQVLARAGLAHARALVAATDTDAGNLFITVSARALRPDLFIVARVRVVESEEKLRRGGADRVVNPQSIGGARMAAFVLQPHVTEFLDVVMHDGGLEFRLEEFAVPSGSAVSGSTIRDAHLRDRTGALVLAIREQNGTFITNPSPDALVEDGHVLIAIGTPSELEALQGLIGDGAAR